MSDPLHSLEQHLGRTLAENARGAVETLNDIDAEMEAEVRELARRSRIAAVDYLQYHVRIADTEYTAPFIDEVLLAAETNVPAWGRRDLLCHPQCEFPGLLRATVHELLQPLEAQGGARWYRIPLTDENWYWSGAGCPGVFVRDAPYWWNPTVEDCDAAELDPDSDGVEKIDDLDVAARRWVASRVAWRLKDTMPSIRTVEDACRLLEIASDGLSQDAVVAIRGLIGSHQAAASGLPGFTGPDSLFKTPPR